jgi:hypothetical protein
MLVVTRRPGESVVIELPTGQRQAGPAGDRYPEALAGGSGGTAGAGGRSDNGLEGQMWARSRFFYWLLDTVNASRPFVVSSNLVWSSPPWITQSIS